MIRCTFALLLASLLMVGCRSEDTAADGSSNADGDDPIAVVDNAYKGPPKTPAVTDPGKIVTPTADDSDERAKAREMDIAGLIGALNDPTLATAATDELASRGSDAVKPLIDALASDNATVQQKAIFTLGQLGPVAKDALPKLKELAESGDSEVVQDSAKFAIDAIEPK